MKRVLPLIVTMLFLAGIFIVPVGVTSTPARLQETSTQNNVTLEQHTELSWLPNDKNARVAVYNTTNATEPSYVDSGIMELNNTWVISVLTNAGYSVTEVNLQDIQNHELQTGNYDVLVLADLVPNENITHLVKEFWLGGGGILAFDTSCEYLNYAGILPIESEGGNGRGTYWQYIIEDTGVVANRHPVSKSYQIDDTLTNPTGGYAMYYLSAFSGLTQEEDLTVLVEDDDTSDNIKALALDSSLIGGKVVHIGVPSGGAAPPDYEPMMVDAVEWLTPSPKGRVLYDMTHNPYYGVDSYDLGLSQYSTGHSIMRNDLVARGYTFDKLYPSSIGNLTSQNLESFDVLMICGPKINFTSQEVTAVSNWISSGGALVVIGDHVTSYNYNLNYLISNTNLKLNISGGGNTLYPADMHITHEGISSMSALAPGTINYTAPAFPVCNDTAGNIIIAFEEVDEGRVAVIADFAIFRDTNINALDNREFAVNMYNWLTAGDMLVFAGTGGSSSNPNQANPYRGPVAFAMNALEFPFLMTTDMEYFNHSLATEDWTLVVVDMPSGDLTDGANTSLLNHLNAGGKLLLSTWQMNTVLNEELIPLYDYLGVSYAGNQYTSPQTFYVWDDIHPLFNTPIDYDADNFTAVYDYVIVDGVNLSIYDNATALAGLSGSSSTTNATIVLGANGNAITNGMLLTTYDGDTDDSTYSDAFEIYMNEIIYLLRPRIDSPSDFTFEFGDTGVSVTWVSTSIHPDKLVVERNSVEITNTPWDGESYSESLNGYDIGTYTFEITVTDDYGLSASDIVVVTVEDTTAPTITYNPDDLEFEEGTTGHELNWTFEDLDPDTYVIEVNGTTEASGSWTSGVNVTLLVDDLSLDVGVHNVTIIASDSSGNSVKDEVIVTVTEETTTTDTTTTDTATETDTTTDTGTTIPPPDGDYTMIIIIAAIAAVIIIIVVVIINKRKS